MKLRVKLLLLLLVCPAVVLAASDVLTYHNDNARTGQNLNETILTAANVNSTAFGKLFVVSVDGLVDAQPLVVAAVSLPGQGTHDVLLVATEHASLYAFDADTGTTLWQVSLLGAGETPSDDHGCSQVTPEIGITATPVVDRSSGSNGAVYAVAMSKDASGNYFQRLHALDLTTGRELFGGPRTIQATFPRSGGNVIFDPGQYKERPGLLLLNHVVYTAWSSHCDYTPYTGWVMGYDETTLGQVSVLNLTPNGSEGSVWASGAGPAADTSGNIFLLAANGTFDTTLDSLGFPTQHDYGNAFLKLSTSGNTLAVADYFNMFDTVSESNADEDLGSGGAMVLPDMVDGSGRTRHLAVGAGKDANIYLADRDKMGKFSPTDNSAIYQELPSALGGPEFGTPAYFNGAIYYGAAGDNLVAFKFSIARLVATPASKTSLAFGYPGTTPSISANGATNGIVWAAENGSSAVLHAYDANDLSLELYNSNQAAGGRDQFGAGNKFITPMIANGKVYVGTTNGVAVFGLR
jgi:outer membrane protein assembly factor BamB